MDENNKIKNAIWHLSPFEYIKTYIRNKKGLKYLEELEKSENKTESTK
jgi:hypothetical protein